MSEKHYYDENKINPETITDIQVNSNQENMT